MEKEKYNTYKSVLNANVKTRLEHIRKYVFTGQASVMVGAGFSKNGETSDNAGMKDWNELAKIFYKKLYCKVPTCADLTFMSPIRLASMVEATFGKKVLDEIIENTLSPSDIKPGLLHEALLSVPWHDVFTTNYDTLLERSYAASSYTLVENRESLLYSIPPRIIKLHGSLRHTHPYIITEEDYRTYPQLHPEMVNTVRQAMVENLFCLIGFSGNDPNFLSWLGWLRDVMGNNLTPVYMIVYDKGLHISNVSLLKQLSINVINLESCLEGGTSFKNIQEALDFLLTYLVDESEIDSGNVDVKKKKQQFSFEASKILHEIWSKRKEEGLEETLNEATSRLAIIRQHCLDWVVIPRKYYGDFRDVDAIFPNLNLDFSNISQETKVKFLYELDFRLNVSYTPKSVSWFLSALDGIEMGWGNHVLKNLDLTLSLKVSLLSIYRQKCDKERFASLCIKLEEYYDLMNEDVQNRFNYEKCLADLYELSYVKVRRTLREWNVRRSNVQYSLWKASIIAEVNGCKEAAKYLVPVVGEVKRKLLTANIKHRQIWIASQRMLKQRIKLYDWERYNELFWEPDDGVNDSLELERLFLTKLNESNRKPQYKESIGFNINNHTQSWNSGSNGFVEEYLYAKRILLLYESIGMPIGFPNYSINRETIQKAFNSLISYNPRYVIANIIRSSNSSFVDFIIDKTVIIGIDEYNIKKLYSNYYQICKRTITQDDQYAYYRIASVIIPILVKFCVVLDDEDIIDVLNLVRTELILKGNSDKFNELLVTIYNSLSPHSIEKIAEDMFGMPLVDEKNRALRQTNILMPDLLETGYVATDKVVEIIKDGLTGEVKDTNNKINAREWAYDRLIKLYPNHLTDKDKNTLEEAVFKWRQETAYRGNAFYSFNLLPYNSSKDSKNPEEEIIKTVQEFKAEKYRYNHSSETFSSFNENLSLLSAFHRYITQEYAEALTDNIRIFLSENKDILLRDDSKTFMGGMRYFTEPMFETINTMLTYLAEIGIEKEKALSIQKIIEEYEDVRDKYNIPLMQAIVALNEITKDKEPNDLLQKICGMLMAANYKVKMDAALALYQFKGNVDYDEIIKKIINYTEVSQGGQTFQYLKIIRSLVLNNIIDSHYITNLIGLLERIIYSVQLNSSNENEASEIRFEVYELIGMLSTWDMNALKNSQLINKCLEGIWGLRDEQKGMNIGKWIMRNRIK